LTLLFAGIVASTALLLLAASDPEDLLKQATAQYERHNYKTASATAEKAAAAAGDDEELRLSAQRIQAMALCRLRHNQGYELAKKLTAEGAAYADDPELWLAMGYARENHHPRKDAYEAYRKAGELYEKAGKPQPAADAYFRAIKMISSTAYGILPKPADVKNWNWNEQRKAHLEEMARLVEHVVALDIPDGKKAEVLHFAAVQLTRIGDWESAEKGIRFAERLVRELPKEGQAVHAQLLIGDTYNRFSRYVEAIEAYRQVVELWPNHGQAKLARERIEAIKAPQVHLAVQKAFLPGEKPRVFWQIRNMRMLKLTARSVDLVAAVQALRQTDADRVMGVLALAAGEAAAEWTFDTPDDGKHQPHQHSPTDQQQTTLPIAPPLKASGAYLLTATGANPDGKTATAHCLVVISKIAAVAKLDSDELVMLANDAADGTPADGAEVAVLRYWGDRNHVPQFDRGEGKVDDAGLATVKMADRQSCSWIAAVKHGDEQALCAPSSYSWGWWGQRRQHQIYGFTERPVYRPKDTVHFKQIIRVNKQGEYENFVGKKVRIEIRNPKGETVYAKDHVTDAFGTVEGDWTVPEDAPLGLHYIQVDIDGSRHGHWYSQGNHFRVEEYKKPEFKVTVEPAKSDYRVGDEMQIKVAARYYYGQPVVAANVKFTIRKQSYTHRHEWPRPYPWYYEDIYYGRRWGHWRPWWRPRLNELVTQGTVQTDDNGEAFITLKAEPFKGHEKEDLKFVVETEVTDASRRVIRGSGSVKVTHAPFFIYGEPASRVYGPGDSVEIRVKTENPSGQPVPGTYAVEAWRVERIRKVVKDDKGNERVEFEEKLAQKVHAGEVKVSENGRGAFRFTPDVTGRLKIILREKGLAEDADRKAVEGDCYLWIASKTGAEQHYAYNDLTVEPAGDQFEVGEKMKVLVNTRFADSRVLLTGEADHLYFHRVVHVKKNSTLVEIDVDAKLSPNFRLTATLLRDGRVLMDTKEIVVPPTHKFLKVRATFGKGSMGGGEDGKYQPREKADIKLTVTDMQTGKPVRGQLALMLVDSSVYYIQPEFREAIEKAFYGFTRHVQVRTTDSYAGPAAMSPWRHHHRGSRSGERQAFFGAAADGMAMPPAAREAEGPMAEKAAADGNRRDLDEADLASTVVREHFKDTVLWAGAVETDADGVATVPVTMPDQLTTFALHAIAVDKDSQVGQTQTDVITTKRVIVRLQSGRFFTEGDHSYVTVIAHNYYDEPQKLRVDLAADGGLKLRQVKLDGKWLDYHSGEPLDVLVAGQGEIRLDFRTTAERPGEVKLLARARGVKESDALQLTKPIVPWGVVKMVGSGGTLRGDGKQQTAQWKVTLPKEIGEGSQELTVTLNPSVAAVAMESLPYLARYPYGCAEQTMSRFMPLVLMRRTLQDAGVDLDVIRKRIEQESAKDPKLAARYKHMAERFGRNPVYSQAEVDKMIAKGIDRLKELQHSDGGWGWWKNDRSDPYMTAYVMYGLSIAKECDVAGADEMIQRGAQFLAAEAARPKLTDEDRWDWWRRHLDNDNTRAFVLFALGRTDAKRLGEKKIVAHLERMYEGRDELSDYGRALLAMALDTAGMKKEARIVVENFENTATIDEKEGVAHWGRMNGWWYWYHGATETTSWVLQAMLQVAPKDKHVPMAVSWLVRNRRDMYWWNTKSTAMAVNALTRYAKVAGELDCDQTYTVTVGGITKTVRVTKENLFTFDSWVTISGRDLPPGEHTVSVSRKGKGGLYWNAYLKYFTKEEPIKAAGVRLDVARKYYRLVPEKFTNTRHVWKNGQYVKEEFPDLRHKREPLEDGAELASGDLIECQLTIQAPENYEYMMFEDPKPSGCEPHQLVSGAAYGGGVYANMELRDTKVVFFASWLRKGENKLSYKLVCEQPGTFRIIPTSGEAMYSPFVRAISDSGKLTITEKPE